MRVGSKGLESGRARAAARTRGTRLDIVTPRAAEAAASRSRFSLFDNDSASTGIASATVDASEMAGTVATKLAAESDTPYDPNSPMLTQSAPFGSLARLVRSETSGPSVSAADLVAELNEINAEIHRIMTQVEKAVARLVTS